MIEPAHDRRIAAEEDRCVLRLERAQAAIGFAVRLVGWRPGEAAGVEPGALEAAPQEIEPGLAEGNLLAFGSDLNVESAEAVLAGELAQLPFGGHLRRQELDRYRLDDQTEDSFVKAFRQQELGQTPS